MDAAEIATQLTLAIVNKNELYAKYDSRAEKQTPQRVGEAYNVILTEVVKVMENANKVIQK